MFLMDISVRSIWIADLERNYSEKYVECFKQTTVATFLQNKILCLENKLWKGAT